MLSKVLTTQPKLATITVRKRGRQPNVVSDSVQLDAIKKFAIAEGPKWKLTLFAYWRGDIRINPTIDAMKQSHGTPWVTRHKIDSVAILHGRFDVFIQDKLDTAPKFSLTDVWQAYEAGFARTGPETLPAFAHVAPEFAKFSDPEYREFERLQKKFGLVAA